MISCLAVILGGSIGAGFRYSLIKLLNKRFGLKHWATFWINVTGCLFLGYVLTLALKRPDIVSTDWKLFLATGIAGSYTTFSTFSYENMTLIKSGQILQGIIYPCASVIIGLLAIGAGHLFAQIS